MNILCRLGLHDWQVKGWFGKKSLLRNRLTEGRIRSCSRCPKEQKYDGKNGKILILV